VSETTEAVETDGAAGGELTARTYWYAVIMGTALAVVSFWAIFFGAVAIAGDAAPGPLTIGPLVAGGGRYNPQGSAAVGFGIGVAVMPVAFYLLARLTARPVRGLRVLNASLVAVGVWVWLPALTGEPLTPTVAAFGAGGAFVLGYRGVRRPGYRAVAVVLTTLYVFLLFGVLPWVALAVGPFAALPAIGWADSIARRKAGLAGDAGERPARRRGGRAAPQAAPEAARRQGTPERRGRSGVRRRR
jgi:uncharacterized membrane protein YhaH (DUF805 family)